MSSKEIIKILKKDRWYLVRTKGSHHQFAHDVKKGLVTVPHLKKDLDNETLKSIFKQAGIKI